MKKYIIALLLLVAVNVNTQAQLGGLLKKAKDKITEKKVEEKKADVVTEKTPESKTSIESKTAEANSELEFQFIGLTNSYGEYGPRDETITLKKIKSWDKQFFPLECVRKVGEKGVFHFVKDYPELAPYTKAENKDLKITFSSEPRKEGKGVVSTFTSKSHIYARLENTKGTLKDAFKFTGKDDLLTVRFVTFNDETVTYENVNSKIYLTDKQINEKYIDFDILPEAIKATFNTLTEDSYYMSNIYNLFTQRNFPKSGNYKMGVEVYGITKDEWGSSEKGDIIRTGGYFDFTFSPSDIATINTERQTIWDTRKDGIAKAPRPLPSEWTAKTSALTMGVTQDKLLQMLLGNEAKFHKVIKFFASSSSGGWTAVYDQGAVLPRYRHSNQYYTVFLKIINPASANVGKCWFQTFGLRQQYMGGGTYGVSTMDANDWYFTECDKMK